MTIQNVGKLCRGHRENNCQFSDKKFTNEHFDLIHLCIKKFQLNICFNLIMW